MSDFWQEAQAGEIEFWGRCINTYGEETKQVKIYAPRMKLTPYYSNYMFDLQGKSVLDIGSGPVSLLLKCKNVQGVAVDPLMDKFPQWVRDRYDTAGIKHVADMGESFGTSDDKFDEVWIYNVLQHTNTPIAVISNAKLLGKKIRIFEWVDVPPNTEHPHVLKAGLLDEWLGKKGMTETINDESFANAYYNVVTL